MNYNLIRSFLILFATVNLFHQAKADGTIFDASSVDYGAKKNPYFLSGRLQFLKHRKTLVTIKSKNQEELTWQKKSLANCTQLAITIAQLNRKSSPNEPYEAGISASVITKKTGFGYFNCTVVKSLKPVGKIVGK